MTPDFLQGFYTCLLIEGIGLTIVYIVRLYIRLYTKRCKTCNSPNIDDCNKSIFGVERLAACSECGETMPVEYAPPNARPVYVLPLIKTDE